MLKIWKGPEMEGFKLQDMTIFICSDEILDLRQIEKIITANIKDISKIYLGAGRERFRGFGNYKYDKLFIEFCKTNNLLLTIETEPQYLNDLIYFLDYAEIILTFRIKSFKIQSIKNIKLKLDDYKYARVFNNDSFADTDLATVTDNKYDCDEIIYEGV